MVSLCGHARNGPTAAREMLSCPLMQEQASFLCHFDLIYTRDHIPLLVKKVKSFPCQPPTPLATEAVAVYADCSSAELISWTLYLLASLHADIVSLNLFCRRQKAKEKALRKMKKLMAKSGPALSDKITR